MFTLRVVTLRAFILYEDLLDLRICVKTAPSFILRCGERYSRVDDRSR